MKNKILFAVEENLPILSFIRNLINFLLIYLKLLFLMCFYPVCGMAQTSWSCGFPTQAIWGWNEEEFKDDGYKTFIDLAAFHSPYELLAVSVRLPGRETTTKAVHDQIKRAAEYANQRGISLVADLDVRTARREFEARYPDELQELKFPTISIPIKFEKKW